MNTKIIFSVAGFIVGALTGSIATGLIVNKKNQKKFQQELDSVWADVQNEVIFKKPSIEKVMEKTKPEPTTGVYNSEPSQQIATESIIKTNCYTYPDIHKTDDLIYEITENDLDEEEYKQIELMLYADGILVDDNYDPIHNVEACVGPNFFEIFHGKDEIYIRNEKRNIDYIVCRSLMTYDEYIDRHPEKEHQLRIDDAMDDYYSEEDDGDEDE